MANKNNQNKEGKVTAGELFEKLNGKNGTAGEADLSNAHDLQFESVENGSRNGFSIDVSGDAESDSELDINDLLKKYMSEFGEDEIAGGGVLSGLKRSHEDYSDSLPYGVEDGFSAEDEDSLISALDSAFGPEEGFDFDGGDEAVPFGDEAFLDEGAFEEEVRRPEKKEKKKKEKKEKKPFFLFGLGRKKGEEIQEDEGFADEGLSFADGAGEDLGFDEAGGFDAAFSDEVLPEGGADGLDVRAEEAELEALENSVEEVSFRTTDIRLGDIAELESALSDTEPGNRSTPETRKNGQPVEGLLDRLAEFEEEEAALAREEEIPDGLSPEEAAILAELGVSPDALISEDGGRTQFTPADEFAEFAAEDGFDAGFGEAIPDGADSDIGADGTAVEEAAEWDETLEEDPTDLNLRVAFGLDEEDAKDSSRGAKKLGDQLEAKQYKREKRAKLDRQEFVDKTQIPKLRKEYKERTLSLRIKLVLALVFTAVLVWFENITFFTDIFTGTAQQFAGAFDPAVYPVVYIMVSLQLTVLVCLCAYRQIFDGFKCLIRGIPNAQTLLSFLFVCSVIYSAVLARLIETPTEPVMFNSVVAVCGVLTLLYDYLNTKREKMNFDIVSAKKTKHIVRRLPDEESMSQAQAFMEQTDACDVMKVEKTDFVDGFFGRMYQPDPAVTVFMTCMMSIAAAAAVLVGFFVNLRGGSGAEVLRAGYAALLVTAPVSVLCAFSYPFYRATRAASQYDSAIIGESSLAEYSNASIISFDDKNVFPSYSVKIQNIKIFNNARVDRVLYYAASVFAHAGGPLQDVFEVATLEMGHSDDVKIFDTEAGFLASQVNGVNIIFGSGEKLTEKGFVIPEENASDDVDFSGELSIMYMFREDKLVAKIYVKYVMDADIDLILKQFQGTGLYVCVRTFDPNIDERMIAKKLNMRRIPLKVVRYANTEEVTKYEAKVDSGLVTSSSPKSLLQVISYCDKVLHTRRVGMAFSILALVIGLAAMLLLSGSIGAFNSLFIVLYHLLWILPGVLAAKMLIR